MITRWSHLAIISRPADPAPERDLAYTVRLHLPDGLSRQVEDVVTALLFWPEFDCLPALKVGETDPATGEKAHGLHPVLWIGQEWYPWIVHRPKSNECDESPNFPSIPEGGNV